MSSIGQEFGVQPRTHDCPECDGLIPAGNVKIGKWKLITNPGEPVREERELSIKCPHCPYKDSRTETKQL
jgi:hypothetical protein